jgi:hypothetical protein
LRVEGRTDLATSSLMAYTSSFLADLNLSLLKVLGGFVYRLLPQTTSDSPRYSQFMLKVDILVL